MTWEPKNKLDDEDVEVSDDDDKDRDDDKQGERETTNKQFFSRPAQCVDGMDVCGKIDRGMGHLRGNRSRDRTFAGK